MSWFMATVLPPGCIAHRPFYSCTICSYVSYEYLSRKRSAPGAPLTEEELKSTTDWSRTAERSRWGATVGGTVHVTSGKTPCWLHADVACRRASNSTGVKAVGGQDRCPATTLPVSFLCALLQVPQHKLRVAVCGLPDGNL